MRRKTAAAAAVKVSLVVRDQREAIHERTSGRDGPHHVNLAKNNAHPGNDEGDVGVRL